MSALKDLTGQRFGRLTVMGRQGSDNQGAAVWRCQCDCGAVHAAAGYQLRRGGVKSCGCLSRETTAKRCTTHGKSSSRLWRVWSSMKNRCYCVSHRNYASYGGRGITVCDEWRNDFQDFYDWAMANGYDENAPYMKCTIDRIDNDKGYSPDNCRWVDIKAQRHNRSDMKE